MRVLLVTNWFPVLYNSFTMNEIMSLLAKDIDVDILALRPHNKRIVNANTTHVTDRVMYCSDLLVNNHPGVSRWLVKQSVRLRSRFSKDAAKKLGEFLFGHRTRSLQGLEDGCHDTLEWNQYALPNVAKWVSTRNPDIIHAAFGNCPATMAMLLSRHCGIPFTFEAHAYDLFVDFPCAGAKLEEARAVFTISQYNKDYLVSELGADADKVAVMRVPIDQNSCDSFTDAKRTPGRVIAVCRLHPIKGLEDGIRAFAAVAEEFPDAQYNVVGEGALRPRLEALIRELGMVERVHLLGSMGSIDALREIAGSSFCLLPSVIADNGDRDGIPTSLVEAMYLGLPAISTRVSGIPELVDDGENGLLVDPGDLRALTDSLRILLADPERVKQMGASASRKVRDVFYASAAEDVLLAQWQTQA